MLLFGEDYVNKVGKYFEEFDCKGDCDLQEGEELLMNGTSLFIPHITVSIFSFLFEVSLQMPPISYDDPKVKSSLSQL